MIKVDLSGAAGFFDPAGPDYAAAAQAHRTLLEHTGAGADFTGWLDLPERMHISARRAPWSCCGRGRSPVTRKFSLPATPCRRTR